MKTFSIPVRAPMTIILSMFLLIGSVVSQTITDYYPTLPAPWAYLGNVFYPAADQNKTITNFFLERQEIYSSCPGFEYLNAGHHGGTHMVVQYRDISGQWHWRPALYPDAASMPQYPPVADQFSGCYFVGDPELPGAYFIEYQRSDPEGAYAVFYMSPRQVGGPADQPFDGHALLSARTGASGPGDPISKGGMWGLPVPFRMNNLSCLLLLPTGHRDVEPPDGIWSTYPIIMEHGLGVSWMDVETNNYRLIWIKSGQDWIPLRFNGIEITGGEPSPGDKPGLQASAAVFGYNGDYYMLVMGGGTRNSTEWFNPSTRGFVYLYRFLENSGTQVETKYRVELIRTIVDPGNPLPNTADKVGGFMAGALRPLPLHLKPGPTAIPDFLIGVLRLEDEDLNRWKYDFGMGLRFVSGGFATLEGFINGDGLPDYRIIPPDPDPERNYPSGYGLSILPGENGDDVIFKTVKDTGFIVVYVPNKDGRFSLSGARIIFDTDSVVPSAEWECHDFSACFMGVFPTAGEHGCFDLVFPFSLRKSGLHQGSEEERHTYVIWPSFKRELTGAFDNQFYPASQHAALSVRTYPNPSEGTVNITIFLTRQASVEMIIYSTAGREMERICRDNLPPGIHRTTWTPGRDREGVYFCRIRCGDTIEVIKLIVGAYVAKR